MDKKELLHIVFTALDNINQTRTEGNEIPLNNDTALYGKEGYLDSMDLVGLLIDIEDLLADHSIDIVLSDDKAMSQKNSPFRSVDTLVTFIESQLAESHSA